MRIAWLLFVTCWGTFAGHHAAAQSPFQPSQHEKLDIQARCAAQAEKAFNQWKSEGKKEGKEYPGYKVVSAEYQSHYNAGRNRCFIAVRTNGENGATTKWLADAYENRLFAFYFWMPDPSGVREYSQTPPTKCELTPSAAEKRICSSEREYDDFVASYMEE